jgi:hypothetical protein
VSPIATLNFSSPASISGPVAISRFSKGLNLGADISPASLENALSISCPKKSTNVANLSDA